MRSSATDLSENREFSESTKSVKRAPVGAAWRALLFLYTDLTPAHAFEYLTNAAGASHYGAIANYNPSVSPDSSGAVSYTTLDVADLVKVNPSATGTPLNTNWINQVQADGGVGIVLLEGIAATTQPLWLEIWCKDDQGSMHKLGGVPLYLSISGVEQMFRHLNLRDGADAPTNLPGPAYSGDTGMASSMGTPANFPDELLDDKWLIFAHGYNVSAQNSRGWESEMFKRFYWSGSKAKFIGVDWLGNPNGDYLVSSLGLVSDYYLAVMNAFATAPGLATKLNALSGSKTIVGHSLGCQLTAIALNDCSLQVNHACLVDAAMASECFDGDSAEDLANMTYSPWTEGEHSTPNYPRSLWASDWYKLFQGGSDARQTLTWKNRFINAIPVIHSFYSSTEDVLGKFSGTPTWTVVNSAFDGFGSYAWVIQEKAKGNIVSLFGVEIVGTGYGGWGFNKTDPLCPECSDPKWYKVVTSGPPAQPVYNRWSLTPGEVEAKMTADADLLAKSRWTPLFNPGWGREPNDARNTWVDTSTHTGPDWIFSLYSRDTSGSAVAADSAKNTQLLAQAIPALSKPVGANFTTAFDDQNYNMPAQFADAAHWPRIIDEPSQLPTWHHSDVGQVAYPYLYKLFNQLVSISNQ